MPQTIGIVGATGAVGRIIRQLLESRQLPVSHVRFIASERSAGKKLAFRGEEVTVQALKPDVFDDIDICIASTPDDISQDFAPQAVERGTIVVDESGAWRMDPTVPLVVPEVNPEELENHHTVRSLAMSAGKLRNRARIWAQVQD